MSIQHLYVTEVTQKTTANGEVVIIAHGTENATNKSTINADVLPSELLEMFGILNNHFKTICGLGPGVNYAITGFKIRDAKSGNQEIQFAVNIRAEIVAFEDAKTAWMEIRETDLAAIQNSSYEVRERVRAVNGIIEQFNELQHFIRDHIAEWLEMEGEPKQMSLFDRPSAAPMTKEFAKRNEAANEFHATMNKLKEKDGLTVTISAGERSVQF